MRLHWSRKYVVSSTKWKFICLELEWLCQGGCQWRTRCCRLQVLRAESSKSIMTLETNIQLLLFLLIGLVWNRLFNVYFQITFRGRELTKPLKFNLTLLILREVLTSRELWRHSWKNQPHHEHGGEREIGSTVCWAESSAKFPTKYLRPPILWQRYSGRN
jgi:hypothetical protein